MISIERRGPCTYVHIHVFIAPYIPIRILTFKENYSSKEKADGR